MDNTELRYARTHPSIGQAVTERLHGGYAISTRTGGGLLRKINAAMDCLERVPLDSRDEDWAASVGGVCLAAELLADGRRAKAGKVLAMAVR